MRHISVTYHSVAQFIAEGGRVYKVHETKSCLCLKQWLTVCSKKNLEEVKKRKRKSH